MGDGEVGAMAAKECGELADAPSADLREHRLNDPRVSIRLKSNRLERCYSVFNVFYVHVAFRAQKRCKKAKRVEKAMKNVPSAGFESYRYAYRSVYDKTELRSHPELEAPQ